MAKVKAPLFSIDARGNIKRTLVYTFRKGVNIVKYFTASPDPNTHAQILQRGLYSKAVDAWNDLTGDQKLLWNNYIGGDVLTGYNAFIKNYLLTYDIEQEYIFGWMISFFWGFKTIIFGGAFKEDLLIGILFND